MTKPTQIPDALIPELVEWLMENVDKWWITDPDNTALSIISIPSLTAALKAFNERKEWPTVALQQAIADVHDTLKTNFGSPK